MNKRQSKIPFVTLMTAMFLRGTVLICLNGILVTFHAAAENAELIFRSGFESGVSVNSPIAPSGQWRQLISGADEGYDWSVHLVEIGGYGAFQYLVPSEVALDSYVDTRIDIVIGPDEADTKALFRMSCLSLMT